MKKLEVSKETEIVVSILKELHTLENKVFKLAGEDETIKAFSYPENLLANILARNVQITLIESDFQTL